MEQDIDNAFAELGLGPGATEPEVKAAWRRLVSQWHPDRNDSAAAVAKMQRINRAVEAIRRSGFRTAGPSAGTGAAKASARPEPPPQHNGHDRRAGAQSAEGARASDPGGFDADEASADSHAAGASTRTIQRKVRLTLEEAAFGCTKVLRGRVTDACSPCEGAGYRVLGGHCSQCHGSGAVRERSWFGWMGTQTECDACHGGGIARQTCGDCEGSGKAAVQRYQVTVRFPHGVRDGDQLTVKGRRGKAGSPPGELNIRVEVRESDVFQLDADGSLRCEVMVDGFAWIANRPVEVPVLGGSQTIQLRRDQLHHRLEGKGFPVERRGPRGDQWITILPVFPQRMSTDQQILLDQLIATTTGPNAKHADERLQQWNRRMNDWKAADRRRS